MTRPLRLASVTAATSNSCRPRLPILELYVSNFPIVSCYVFHPLQGRVLVWVVTMLHQYLHILVRMVPPVNPEAQWHPSRVRRRLLERLVVQQPERG